MLDDPQWEDPATLLEESEYLHWAQKQARHLLKEMRTQTSIPKLLEHAEELVEIYTKMQAMGYRYIE